MEETLQVRKPLCSRIYLFKEGCSVPHGNRHWLLIASDRLNPEWCHARLVVALEKVYILRFFPTDDHSTISPCSCITIRRGAQCVWRHPRCALKFGASLLNWQMAKYLMRRLGTEVKDRQCTFNVTLMPFRATIVAVEKQKKNIYYIFWECFCSRSYPTCNAHAPYCHLCSTQLLYIFPHHLINDILEKSYWA